MGSAGLLSSAPVMAERANWDWVIGVGGGARRVGFIDGLPNSVRMEFKSPDLNTIRQ